MKKTSLFLLSISIFALCSCDLHMNFGTDIVFDFGHNTATVSILLSQSRLSLQVGDNESLTARINPSSVSNKEITWSSSDETVCSVINGYVTALKVGSAVITAESPFYENVKASCSVIVSASEESELSKRKLDKDVDDYYDNYLYEINNLPNEGEQHLLIIPIWFTDSSSYISASKKDSVRNDIYGTFFGTNDEIGWRSVNSYYYELSHGKLDIKGEISPWYEINSKSTSFYSENNGADNTSSLVATASSWYFKQSGAKPRSYFDTNNDGYLDAVILIYGAPDYCALNHDGYNMWAYAFWLQSTKYKSVSNPGPNSYLWASYDFMYGDNAYSKTGKSYYSCGDTSYCDLDAHTYIHETGHLLGLEDYYDYSNQYIPAGGFSMQDFNVGSHDPFSVLSLGFVDPYVPTQNVTLKIKPFQSSGDLILLSPSFEGSAFEEYLLLELYTPTGLNAFDSSHRYFNNGYPKGPSTAGIRLWHVDARLAKCTNINIGTFSKTIYTDPSVGNVVFAFSNTYYNGQDGVGYESVLGSQYADFNILQLIRNNTSTTYRPKGNIADSDMFSTGDVFNMSTFSNQFKNNGKLNSGASLGWTISFDRVTDEGATIILAKQ